MPHCPFVLGISVPDGSGGNTEELVADKVVELVEDIVEELGTDVGLGVTVVEVVLGASPHLPNCG